MNDSDEAIKQWAELTIDRLNSWCTLSWHSYLYILWVSTSLSVIVPFGIAMLLYVPDENKNTVNIIVLAISCLSLVLSIINHVMRFKERGSLLRTCYEDLNFSYAKYCDGIIPKDEFVQIAEEMKSKMLEEGKIV